MSFFFKNPQSYFSYLTQIWHFSILPNGEIFNFFIKFWRTCDTSIKMFCEMAEKPPKSNGIFLILPLMRDPSTSERERVEYFFNQFTSYLQQKGIRREFSSRYMPEQSSVTERWNQTLVEVARAMLKEKSMSICYWVEVIWIVVYIQNQIFTSG